MEQEVAAAKMISRAFHLKNKNVTPEQMIAFFQASGSLDKQKGIKIAGLVHFINEDEEEEKNAHKALS